MSRKAYLSLALLMLVAAGARQSEAGVLRRAAGPSFEAQARATLASFSSTSSSLLLIEKGCDAAVPKCCYKPCIKYFYLGCRRVCCECGPPVKAVLKVKDPCCCCYVNVPVCLPVCCKGKPCVTSRCGLLGRGIVNYSWECGFKIRVVTTASGDIRVTSFGK